MACVALTLTTLGGFALITDDPTTRTYESAVLAVILIGINVLCTATEILIVVFVDCGLGERCQRCCRGGGGVEKTGNNSKVVPVTMEKQNRNGDDTKPSKAPNNSKVLPITNLSTWEA